MKLEVGMFVKYTRGAINGYIPPRIARIVDCSDNELIKIDNGQVILRSDVIKARHKIIDLIEVGDYVNGYLVKDIDYAFDDVVMNNKNARRVPYIDCNKNNYIEDIKSIVTKEQFNNVKYEVE